MTTPSSSAGDAARHHRPMGSAMEAPPCPRGTLRLGIFFDGTGNNWRRDLSEQKLSNVARLWSAYKNDPDALLVRSIYAIGVGTDKDRLGDSVFGSAFGEGGYRRMDGMLHAIQTALDQYAARNGCIPTKVVLDVFGFSRGAALARHFVNAIMQGHFRLAPKYASLTKQSFRIGFLGIFDTVGSFGVPGQNADPGFAFHINPAWIDTKAVHLVADDEYRDNFPLQTLIAGQNRDYPHDMTDGKFVEIVYPGTHSDVGGGYSPGNEHDQASNQYALIPMLKMLLEAQTLKVPFDKDAADKLPRPPSAILHSYEKLMDSYQGKPGLRAAHKRLREHTATAVMLRAQIAEGLRDDTSRAVKKLQLQDAVTRERRAENEVMNLLGWSYGAFQADSAALYGDNRQRGWLHKSHAPFNHSFGMWSDVRGHVLHRDVFWTQPLDLPGRNQAVSKAREVACKPPLSVILPAGCAATELAEYLAGCPALKPVKFDGVLLGGPEEQRA